MAVSCTLRDAVVDVHAAGVLHLAANADDAMSIRSGDDQRLAVIRTEKCSLHRTFAPFSGDHAVATCHTQVCRRTALTPLVFHLDEAHEAHGRDATAAELPIRHELVYVAVVRPLGKRGDAQLRSWLAKLADFAGIGEDLSDLTIGQKRRPRPPRLKRIRPGVDKEASCLPLLICHLHPLGRHAGLGLEGRPQAAGVSLEEGGEDDCRRRVALGQTRRPLLGLPGTRGVDAAVELVVTHLVHPALARRVARGRREEGRGMFRGVVGAGEHETSLALSRNHDAQRRTRIQAVGAELREHSRASIHASLLG